ncbi:hypothetical protein Bca52824_075899 [Brassica carinata]|uniref:Uncharacterized protein n=1 Tax=Brassica carinata TaxID=52824 RepID=A0A8X7TYH9_BRACI|nr:hypothetical protein Bca52824_075890 [Brassica carinata]KAG2256605.1 hypothetical protein Bca52824_075899 [Brassica carinata]
MSLLYLLLIQTQVQKALALLLHVLFGRVTVLVVPIYNQQQRSNVAGPPPPNRQNGNNAPGNFA